MGLSRSCWEQEMGLQLCCHEIRRYGAAIQISTAKSTVYTAECEFRRHIGSFLELAASVS